ncbi:helix-turn-helix transcriptional regulator [Methylobacterium sp. NEAU 140]|uniref:helix-turn-helix domain-containing protein n=1 Tax=Methylobacterium sp. NEAU 140 TaxID=3064945 RepID=UPI0027343690|nr:helix-turn-helix transcriptional regulator [Methylobacterium sp. NEAU 140]MDP4027166.1 helix-turn-helix transcriptional regulator [Methylobacterium sp. NEAU 140]
MSSLFPDAYRRALSLLIEARRAAGVTQVELAGRLGRPQSFVSKYEQGERRLDFVEFAMICRMLNADLHAIVQSAAQDVG